MTESEQLRALQLGARAIYALTELTPEQRAWLLSKLKK